jgi:hypothetical protein
MCVFRAFRSLFLITRPQRGAQGKDSFQPRLAHGRRENFAYLRGAHVPLTIKHDNSCGESVCGTINRAPGRCMLKQPTPRTRTQQSAHWRCSGFWRQRRIKAVICRIVPGAVRPSLSVGNSSHKAQPAWDSSTAHAYAPTAGCPFVSPPTTHRTPAARRKPTSMPASFCSPFLRLADRPYFGSLRQQPPRSTRNTLPFAAGPSGSMTAPFG